MSIAIHFTTVEKFKDKLQVLANTHGVSFNPQETAELKRRLEEAYNEIEGVLIPRGISRVQISTWARGEEYQLDIATFWFCKSKGWGAKLVEEKDWTKPFDRRTELSTVAVINNDGSVLSGSKNAVAVGIDLQTVNENKGCGFRP
jgi:hypothetical protein